MFSVRWRTHTLFAHKTTAASRVNADKLFASVSLTSRSSVVILALRKAMCVNPFGWAKLVRRQKRLHQRAKFARITGQCTQQR